MMTSAQRRSAHGVLAVLAIVISLASTARGQTTTTSPESELTLATQPSDTPTTTAPAKQEESGLAQYFKDHVSEYEPMYFIAGWEDPKIKFQLSLKFKLFGVEESSAWRFMNGFYFSYTQLSLWDISADSSPFDDSNYMPEFFYFYDTKKKIGPVSQITLQGGLEHMSNGQDGADSRSANIVYIRPSFRIGDTDKLNFVIAPKAWAYIGSLSDNPDLADYAGYVSLRASVNFGKGLSLMGIFHMGDDWDHFGTELNLTYPLDKLLKFDAFFMVQYFTGYGESLLDYNQSASALRLGIAFVR